MNDGAPMSSTYFKRQIFSLRIPYLLHFLPESRRFHRESNKMRKSRSGFQANVLAEQLAENIQGNFPSAH